MNNNYLTYIPYITQSLATLKEPKEETISSFIDGAYKTPSFPVEPVRAWNIGNSNAGIETINNTPKVERGITQFKQEGIDVGNMRELLDKFEEAGISVRVTSGSEKRKTKQGNTSRHSSGDAIDITPIAGETYTDLKNKIMNSPELLSYMRENGYGIIDETDPFIKARTGATGDHWHISRGGENFALYGFNKMFGNA